MPFTHCAVGLTDAERRAQAKIHTYPSNPRVHKSLIVAALTGETIEEVGVEMGKSNKTAEFLKLNPFGKVPTLEVDSVGIFESNAIARYFARKSPDAGLYGANLVESAVVDSFVDAAASAENQAGIAVGMLRGYVPMAPELADMALTKVLPAYLSGLNEHLKESKWLVGDRMTLADIITFIVVKFMFEHLMAETTRAPFTDLARWFTTVASQEAVAKVVGDVTYCTEAPKFAKADA